MTGMYNKFMGFLTHPTNTQNQNTKPKIKKEIKNKK